MTDDGQIRRVANDLEHISRRIEAFREKYRPKTTPEDRIWAAMTLALTPDACTSVLNGEPVLAKHLDGAALKHAFRGGNLPSTNSYVHVTDAMLEAIIEAGPPRL